MDVGFNDSQGNGSKMLSQTAEHALRATLYLARQPEGARVGAERIAREIGAPQHYLASTLGALAGAGVITSRRGRFGGFALARPACEIRVADVTGVFDSIDGPARCLLADRPHCSESPCSAHEHWLCAQRAALAVLSETVLAQMIGDGGDEPHDVTRPDAGDHGTSQSSNIGSST
jgi:Rrf2 family protein